MKKLKPFILVLFSIVLSLIFVFYVNNRDDNDKTYLMSDYISEADQSMRNYFNETDLPVYQGEYFEVKVKEAFVYSGENGGKLYIYNLLIAPIYKQKMIISSFKLSSLEYGVKFDNIYFEQNDVFGRVDKNKYTYLTVDQILCNQYQFCLYDNSFLFNYEITEEQLMSCFTNILLTININNYEDKIELKNIKISEFSKENLNNNIINIYMIEGVLSANIHAYVSAWNEDLQ
jgi:hypothetical protein